MLVVSHAEPITYAAWNVYGDVRGNIGVVAVYHYAQRDRADEHAKRINGYVLRTRLAVEPEKTM